MSISAFRGSLTLTDRREYMGQIIGKCKVCNTPLTFATVWVDNGGMLCREHAEAVMDDRYGTNWRLIPMIKAVMMKERRAA